MVASIPAAGCEADAEEGETISTDPEETRRARSCWPEDAPKTDAQRLFHASEGGATRR